MNYFNGKKSVSSGGFFLHGRYRHWSSFMRRGRDGNSSILLIGRRKFTLEIARSPEERQKGLMHREELQKNRGMLFVFEYDQKLSFWMKNTHIPLDIAYVAKDGTIKEIHRMKPRSEKPVQAAHSVRYALEVPRGQTPEKAWISPDPATSWICPKAFNNAYRNGKAQAISRGLSRSFPAASVRSCRAVFRELGKKFEFGAFLRRLRFVFQYFNFSFNFADFLFQALCEFDPLLKERQQPVLSGISPS